MKKELIVHIGMGKTGTTALQQFFGLNRVLLRKTGIYYPKYGTMSDAHHLLSPFHPNNLRNKWKFKAVEDWAPKLSKSNQEKILLSSELMAWASDVEVIEFCNSVQEWFNLTVVVYVRRQDNVIMANYNQLVKAGSQRKELDEIWEDDCARFDYWRIIEPWAKCVGKSRIIVRPYEVQQFYRGDIRHDFMHHVFGRDIPSGYALPSGNTNPRLHPLAIAYKLCLFKLFPDPLKVKKFDEALLAYSSKLDASEGAVFSNQVLLSPHTRNLIVQRNKATNALVAREYLGRQDGVLFYEALPDENLAWAASKLTRVEATLITRFLESFNHSLVQLLFNEVNEGFNSIDLSRRAAADFVRSTLPKAMMSGLEKRSIFTVFKWRYRPENKKSDDAPLMLVSVHFPSVPVDEFTNDLSRKFGDHFVSDYGDRPLGSNALSRNFRAVLGSVRYAQLVHESTEPICVHGHFMPLKYRFLQSTLRKRYVTWISDPIERLAAQYAFWKSSANQGYSGRLKIRMIEEDWSLEAFALCPELRNIYSQYLWGFTPQLFDFIGIAEYPRSENQRFQRDILGSHASEFSQSDFESGSDNVSAFDADFRKQVERFHSEDVALYQQALQIRQRALGIGVCA